MKRMYFVMAILSLLLTGNANAQDPGTAAVLAKLTSQLKVMQEHLESTRAALDVSKRLQEMEEIKTIKKIAESAAELQALVKETENLERDLNRFVDDPTGQVRAQTQLERLKESIISGEYGENIKRENALLLMELRNLQFLEKSKEETKKNISFGSDIEDNQRATAANTLIMSDLLLKNERDRIQKEANDQVMSKEVMKSSGYKKMSL